VVHEGEPWAWAGPAGGRMSFRSFNPGVEAELRGPATLADAGSHGDDDGAEEDVAEELEGAGRGEGEGVLAPPRRGGEAAPRGGKRRKKGRGQGLGPDRAAKKPR